MNLNYSILSREIDFLNFFSTKMLEENRFINENFVEEIEFFSFYTQKISIYQQKFPVKVKKKIKQNKPMQFLGPPENGRNENACRLLTFSGKK